MNQRHRLLITLLKLLDLAVVAAALSAATVLIVRELHNTTLAEFLAMRTRVVNFGIILVVLIAAHLALCLCHLYRSRRMSSRLMEVTDLVKAAMLNTMFFAALSAIFSIRMASIHFLLAFWVFSTLGLVTERLVLRLAAAYLRRHGRDLRYILVLGTNARAMEFANRIVAGPHTGYRLLGFVDNDWPGIADFKRSNFELVCNRDGLAEYLRSNVVDEVALCLPFRSCYPYFSQVASLCAEQGVTLGFHSDLFGLKTARWKAEDRDGDHYITSYTGIGELWPRTVKRVIDIVGASLALILLAPALAAAAIAIRLTSRGPILFLQERVGLNKRRFTIFKFRTMVPDAETLIARLERRNEASGPVFKIRNDPRLTPIGRFLRRTSIDELPQFFNVLKGEMSLVGPRPLPLRDYNGFNEDWQRRRFSVKPGITCLWQVNGRSDISFDQWMKLDLKYMDEWSLWLDLKILAKTVPAVLRGQGAA